MACACLAGCAGTTSAAAPTTAAPPAGLSGTQGAAHFDDGFVQIGTGGKIVDLYIDPMCPHCKEFEESNIPMLLADAAQGRTEIRVHPLGMLDRLSQGTQYSTRASAAIVDVAVHAPTSVGPFLQALYAHQPSENSTGLDDSELGALIHDTDGGDLSEATTQAAYRAWVTRSTVTAETGPLPTTHDIPRVNQVPTAVVDGHVFTGRSTDASAFAEFYEQN